MFETVHLETVTLENDFGPGSVGDPFKHRGHLRRINIGGWHEDIEMNRKQPKRGNVKLARLQVRELIKVLHE